MNVTIRHEPMSEIFDKFHIQGLPIPVVIHHFKGPEPEDADPHDHPCDMDIVILDGAYVEKRFPSGEIIHRNQGDSFTVKATDIHLNHRDVLWRMYYIDASERESARAGLLEV